MQLLAVGRSLLPVLPVAEPEGEAELPPERSGPFAGPVLWTIKGSRPALAPEIVHSTGDSAWPQDPGEWASNHTTAQA